MRSQLYILTARRPTRCQHFHALSHNPTPLHRCTAANVDRDCRKTWFMQRLGNNYCHHRIQLAMVLNPHPHPGMCSMGSEPQRHKSCVITPIVRVILSDESSAETPVAPTALLPASPRRENHQLPPHYDVVRPVRFGSWGIMDDNMIADISQRPLTVSSVGCRRVCDYFCPVPSSGARVTYLSLNASARTIIICTVGCQYMR